MLAALEKQRGHWLASEALAQGPDGAPLSRTAIWKAVRALREQGYRIEAEAGKGYRLALENDILSREGIEVYYRHRGAPIHIYPEVDSTNQVAKQLAINGAPHGTAVLAESQTMGKGRRGRSFFSPSGCGLYLSVVLRPRVAVEEAMLVTAAAAVAVCEAIEAVVPCRTAVKWVNDVWLDGKKVCGILTEAVSDLESGTIDSLVLGMGINCSGSAADFPPELRTVATTIALPGVGDATRNHLAGELLDRVYELEEQIHTRRFLTEYRRRSIVIGRDIRVLSPQGDYTARAMAIDDQAGLVIRREDGDTVTLRAGEVSIRPQTMDL